MRVGVDENSHVTFCLLVSYTSELEYLEAYYVTAAKLLDRDMNDKKCIDILKQNNIYNKNYYRETEYSTYTDNNYVRYACTIQYSDEDMKTMVLSSIRMAAK